MNIRNIIIASVFFFAIASAVSLRAQDKNVILGMSVGMGIGKFKYIGENVKLYEFGKTYSKCAGISFDIPIHILEDKVSIMNEFSFMQFQAKASKHYADTLSNDPVNNYYDESLTFSPELIYITNMVRYYLTKGDFRYYLSFGIYNSFVISSTNRK